MSGICGIVDFGGAPVDLALLKKMTAGMRFRGPDAEGIWHEGGVGFGHTLLRTTEARHERQPLGMGGAWITADARIDGRAALMDELRGAGRDVARNPTDPELILHAYHAWGEKCVEHLLGDFTFAIWDGRERRLFCARDHFGAKPFFYTRLKDGIAFSNTLQVLRLHPAVSSELDEVFIADFLCFVHSHDLERSAFRDIRRLPPAHRLRLTPASAGPERYWTPAIEPSLGVKRSRDIVEGFEEVFSDAVKDRLSLADATLWLSGGLDSACIGVVARDAAPEVKIRAVTVSLEGVFPDQEPPAARQTAGALGYPHTVLLNPAQPFQGWRDLPQAEPSGDPFAGYTAWVLRQNAMHSPVVLCGQGGDEGLHWEVVADVVAAGGPGYAVLHSVLSLLHGRRPALGLRRWWSQRQSGPDSRYRVPDWIEPSLRRELNLDQRCDALNRDARNTIHPHRPEGFRWLTAASTWNWYLERFDPAATGAPAEVRHPFLDLRVVGYLLRVPPFPWCVGKYLLRRALARRIPRGIVWRAKAPLAGDPLVEGTRRVGPGWAQEFPRSEQMSRFVSGESGEWRLDGGMDPAQATQCAWVRARRVALNHWLNAAFVPQPRPLASEGPPH